MITKPCSRGDIPGAALAHTYIVRSGVDNITFQTSRIRTSSRSVPFETVPARRKIWACCKMCIRARVLTAGEKIEGDSDSEWSSFGGHQIKKIWLIGCGDKR